MKRGDLELAEHTNTHQADPGIVEVDIGKFRRQREIGTQIALGMTRWQVVMLFTFEGTMYGILAVALSAVIGGPLLWWQAVAGFSLPEFYGDYGLAIGDAIYPVYPPDLLLKTAAVILAMTTVVSFIPARRIAGMRPTDAIRGRVS